MGSFTPEAVLALLQKQKEEFEAVLKERDSQAAAAAAVAGKKHELGRTNPLLFPPHMYNKEVLQMNQPFLFFSSKRLAGDKSRVKMDEEVLLYAISKALVDDLDKAHRLYKEAKKGLPLRPLHLAFLSGFFELTRPSYAAREEQQRFTEMFTRKAEEDEDDLEFEAECFAAAAPDSCTLSREDEEAFDDVNLCVGGDDADDEFEPEDEDAEEAGDGKPLGGSSVDSVALEHETQRSDITIKVYDRLRMEWVSVCVVEGKEPLSREALYQALCYACRRGLVNRDYGRVAPIYVMAWSASRWSYGVLDIYGVVSLKEGKLDVADFLREQELRWKILKKPGDFKPESKFAAQELSSKLERSKRHLKRRYPGKAEYKDGSYVVASVYVSNQTYDLPSAWDVQSPAALLFYEMLMRIIIGERVVKWTCRDVDEAENLRRSMREARRKLLTAPKRRKLG